MLAAATAETPSGASNTCDFAGIPGPGGADAADNNEAATAATATNDAISLRDVFTPAVWRECPDTKLTQAHHRQQKAAAFLRSPGVRLLKKSPDIIKRAFTPILEHPKATFDHELGGTKVKGFLGDIDGQQVAVFVYKEGPYQGQLASSSVPSPNQLRMWGL